MTIRKNVRATKREAELLAQIDFLHDREELLCKLIAELKEELLNALRSLLAQRGGK